MRILAMVFVFFPLITGCKQDPRLASDPKDSIAALLEKAKQGDADAQFNLGFTYAKGEGVPKDDAEAYKWWLLAGAQGDEQARKGIDFIEKKFFTLEQRAEGQRMAREFKAKAAE